MIAYLCIVKVCERYRVRTIQPLLVDGCSHLPLNAGACFDVMEEEIWKDIPGYEGRYQASSLGRIRSLNYHQTGKVGILVQRLNTNDYFFVLLYKNGAREFISVHRLVCAAFHKNPKGYPCVNHKDENHHNNRADNLEWCTHKYNCNYGTRKQRIYESIPKRPVAQFAMDGKHVATYDSIGLAARTSGAGTGSIWGCCVGRNDIAKGYFWLYADDSAISEKVRRLTDKHTRDHIIQINLKGEEVCRYRNANAASIKTGIEPSTILKCAKGRRKTAGGYEWRYAD